MPGHPEIIDLMNDVLAAELTAVNQYFAHAKLQEHWGLLKLGKHTRDESFEEMRHAEEVIDRILYLDGHPNLQRLNQVRVGESVPEQFRIDLSLEEAALEHYNAGIARCAELGDNGTRQLLERFLADEEEHTDYLRTQLELIDRIGEANYLTQYLHE